MARSGFQGRALPPVALSAKGRASTLPHPRERAPAPTRRATSATEEGPTPSKPHLQALKGVEPVKGPSEAKASQKLRQELEQLRQQQGWVRAPPPLTTPKKPGGTTTTTAKARVSPAKRSSTPSASDSEGDGPLEVLDVQAWTRSVPLKGTIAEEERLQREIDSLTELHQRDQKEIHQLNVQITGMMDRLLHLRGELAHVQSKAQPPDLLANHLSAVSCLGCSRLVFDVAAAEEL
eukprot:GGOE01002348.1.p1 GENE.GGOE01002348.1~~GGOE01002348.1.p1  ORF type:complete len:235 (-),score=39.21 GGOE01002348.1:299-1003(-)